ncbi:WG repeat-containing protein [Cohnella cellulosilytica]|uniref:WG repeat-containing protein n=1 Tax=Cohnella cellulosilytica TaxID=986710 RepID=A0ABW2F575_9BACL
MKKTCIPILCGLIISMLTAALPLATVKATSGAEYDYVDSFREGLARVWKGTKVGFMDESGKEAVPLKYDMAMWYSEGLAAVSENERWKYIDKNGKQVILLPKSYNFAFGFSEGMAIVRKGTQYGYIDRSGKEVVAAKYDRAEDFINGFARVNKGENYGYIDKSGKEAIPLKYSDVWDFSEGLALVRRAGKYGYVNEKGAEAIPLQFESAWPFRMGLAMVRKNGQWMYIDHNGKRVENETSALSYVAGKDFLRSLPLEKAVGNNTAYKDIENKANIVVFGRVICGNTLYYLPAADDFISKNKLQDKVNILFFDIDQPSSSVTNFVSKQDWKNISTFSGGNGIMFEVLDNLGITGEITLPAVVYVNPDGEIVNVTTDYQSKEKIAELITAFMKR